MMLITSLLLALQTTFALAHPQLPVVGPVVDDLRCLVVDVLVTALRQDPQATPYCSSFLKISTVTTSSTTSITVSTTVTTTRTSTVSTCTLPSSSARAFDPLSYPRSAEPGLVQVRSPQVTQPSLPTPTYLNGVVDGQVSSACSCLSIATPTQTVTTTSTSTRTLTSSATVTTSTQSCPTPASECENRGLGYAFYNNTDANNQPNNINDGTYSTFIPENFKTGKSVLLNSVTTRIGGFGDSGRIYDTSETLPRPFFVLNHKGYIFAQYPGTYTFRFGATDDIALLWTGARAVSGWTRGNANVTQVYNQPPKTFQITYAAGSYNPIRFVYANAPTISRFPLTVMAPDGTVLLSDSSNSNLVVQYSCDRMAAPPFAPFGAET